VIDESRSLKMSRHGGGRGEQLTIGRDIRPGAGVPPSCSLHLAVSTHTRQPARRQLQLIYNELQILEFIPARTPMHCPDQAARPHLTIPTRQPGTTGRRAGTRAELIKLAPIINLLSPDTLVIQSPPSASSSSTSQPDATATRDAEHSSVTWSRHWTGACEPTRPPWSSTKATPPPRRPAHSPPTTRPTTGARENRPAQLRPHHARGTQPSWPTTETQRRHIGIQDDAQ
jgi:hypothetical protein